MRLVRILDLETADPDIMAALFDRRAWNVPSVTAACREIVEGVRRNGDRALIEYTRAFDGADISAEGPGVARSLIEQAGRGLNEDLRLALDRAIENVARFHETQVPPPLTLTETAPGVRCGERWTPIDTVCLYVPRGRGAFSSVAFMLAVPARLAGVGRIVMCTPPDRDGRVDAATLYVAGKLGVDAVYRIGGVQAITAVAFGTETVPRCDKILGPGNVYVSAAREILAGVIDTGPPAGPSESLVLADRAADPENVAWNLLVEAEHGENSCAILVTDDRDLASRVACAVDDATERLTPERQAFVKTVLGSRGGILVTRDLDASIAFANRFAAEHVALMVKDPEAILPRLKNAGEILYGDYPTISLANYAVGLNAILPTGGWARSRSGVSVRDFMKVTSIGTVNRDGFEALRPIVHALSRNEGFSAHHEAVLAWRDVPVETGGSR